MSLVEKLQLGKEYTTVGLYNLYMKENKIEPRMQLPSKSRFAGHYQSRITDNKFWALVYELKGQGYISEIRNGVFVKNERTQT